MTLADPAFPASATFDLISAALSNPETRAAAIKSANGVFVFTLKNSSNATASWNIDLKESGAVSKGVPEKSDVTLSLSDDDFQKLVDGKAQAQRLFMMGKLKVKGDVMKATKAEVVLKSARKPAAKL